MQMEIVSVTILLPKDNQDHAFILVFRSSLSHGQQSTRVSSVCVQVLVQIFLPILVFYQAVLVMRYDRRD